MQMNSLPLEIIEYIAKSDDQVWLIMVQVYKFLAEKSDNLQYMDELKMKFLRRKENVKCNEIEFKVVYLLPNGIFHNGDDPSILKSGTLWWLKNDKFHRDNDLPAIINIDGGQNWWQNGQYHRYNNKPAILYPNGTKLYYIFGRKYDINSVTIY